MHIIFILGGRMSKTGTEWTSLWEAPGGCGWLGRTWAEQSETQQFLFLTTLPQQRRGKSSPFPIFFCLNSGWSHVGENPPLFFFLVKPPAEVWNIMRRMEFFSDFLRVACLLALENASWIRQVTNWDLRLNVGSSFVIESIICCEGRGVSLAIYHGISFWIKFCWNCEVLGSQ